MSYVRQCRCLKRTKATVVGPLRICVACRGYKSFGRTTRDDDASEIAERFLSLYDELFSYATNGLKDLIAADSRLLHIESVVNNAVGVLSTALEEADEAMVKIDGRKVAKMVTELGELRLTLVRTASEHSRRGQRLWSFAHEQQGTTPTLQDVQRIII